MKKHRIFIAVNFPEYIKKKLEEHQNKIEEMFTPYQAKGLGKGLIRWVKKENLHITLMFLGYLSDDELLEVIEIINEAVQGIEPLLINLNKICYGPPNKSPRMIWAVGEKSEELSKLQNNLESFFSSSKDDIKEKRNYAPHITLGRINQWEFRSIELEERPIVDADVSLSFELSSIELMESQLKRGGPKYYILESFPLTKS